jgi:hypothetical protein
MLPSFLSAALLGGLADLEHGTDLGLVICRLRGWLTP